MEITFSSEFLQFASSKLMSHAFLSGIAEYKLASWNLFLLLDFFVWFGLYMFVILVLFVLLRFFVMLFVLFLFLVLSLDAFEAVEVFDH
jgi:hypothetical protein